MNIGSISIQRNKSLKEALLLLNKQATGILLLVDDEGVLERTVTDGDLRRLILNDAELDSKLELLPKSTPLVLQKGCSRRDALALMKENDIHHLPVIDDRGCVVEILERKNIDDEILLSTPHIGSEEQVYVQEAFRTNWIAPIGPNVDAFENELADSVGSKYAAALSYGTAAIHLALRILGVGQGDRVFCSSLTFAASANPIVYQGGEPVFIDSEPDSWNMSPVALEKAFEDAQRRNSIPKAVIVVNLYGQSADMDGLLDICDRFQVPVIEDAAESLGATYKGKASGTFGAIGIFSFNGNKIITTSGGGMMVSENEEYVSRAKFLATQARDQALHYEHSEIGYNYRMSNILAGVGRGQLKVLQERVQARRAVFDRYKNLLQDVPEIRWMPEPEWCHSNRWLTACTLEKESRVGALELLGALSEELIEGRPVWKPMHMQPVFAGCDFFKHSDDSISDDIFHRGICLPSGSNMTDAQISRVADTIKTVMN